MTARPRFRVIAGRPIGAPRVETWQGPPGQLENDRRKAFAANPWSDAASDERLLAAAFADRVVLFACIAIGVLMLADFVAPDLATWIVGQPAVVVTR